MQPSTWNDTNQHWVPQFLLKGFGIKGQSSKIYELDKHTRNIELRDVADVASRKRLLTDTDDERMKDIEVRSARVIDRMRNGNLKLGQGDRQILDTLVFAMLQNDPHSGIDKEQIRRDAVRAVSHELGASVNRRGASFSLEHLEAFVNERSSHNYLDISLDREDSLVLKALGFMGLRVYRAVDGEFFVIGDSPVLMVRGTIDGNRSLLNPGSQLVLPINKSSVLVYDWSTPVGVFEADYTLNKEQVRSLNRDYYNSTNCRYIYGRTCDSLRQSSMLQLQWGPRILRKDINDGWLLMQIEFRNIIEARNKKDAEQGTLLDLAAEELVQRAKAG